MTCTTLGHTFRVSASIAAFKRASESRGWFAPCAKAGAGSAIVPSISNNNNQPSIRATGAEGHGRRCASRAPRRWPAGFEVSLDEVVLMVPLRGFEKHGRPERHRRAAKAVNVDERVRR